MWSRDLASVDDKMCAIHTRYHSAIPVCSPLFPRRPWFLECVRESCCCLVSMTAPFAPDASRSQRALVPWVCPETQSLQICYCHKLCTANRQGASQLPHPPFCPSQAFMLVPAQSCRPQPSMIIPCMVDSTCLVCTGEFHTTCGLPVCARQSTHNACTRPLVCMFV